jgi:hypothetical protein
VKLRLPKRFMVKSAVFSQDLIDFQQIKVYSLLNNYKNINLHEVEQ